MIGQVQASIAEVSRRQSEALKKKRRRHGDGLRIPRRGRNNPRTADIEPDNVNERGK